MPADREVSAGPQSQRHNVPLTPRQHIGYAAMLAGLLLFMLVAAIVFGAAM